MSPGLVALGVPLPLEVVRDQVQRGAWWVGHEPSLAVDVLRGLPRLSSIEALLAAWPAPITASVRDPAGRGDEERSVGVSATDAPMLLASGMSLLFDQVQRYLPELPPWLVALRGELGLSALTQQRCMVYATPAGGGTGPHFDHNINVVVQLTGHKTWWLAPNHHVRNPLARHAMGLPVEPELESYAALPMPLELPADATRVELRPGSVLIVPRGTWHATRADSMALSLNFTFTAPTWIDLFSAALRSRLALSAGWRACACPAEPGELAQLLRELADDAPHWSAADILAVTEAVAEA